MMSKPLGHRRVQTTARYAHLTRASVKVAAEPISDSLTADLDTPANVFRHRVTWATFLPRARWRLARVLRRSVRTASGRRARRSPGGRACAHRCALARGPGAASPPPGASHRGRGSRRFRFSPQGSHTAAPGGRRSLPASRAQPPGDALGGAALKSFAVAGSPDRWVTVGHGILLAEDGIGQRRPAGAGPAGRPRESTAQRFCLRSQKRPVAISPQI